MLFLVWFFAVTIAIFVFLSPSFFFPRRVVMFLARFWARSILFGLKWIMGLGYEIRGREHVPTGAALVASKHFAAWETIAFFVLVPDPALVMKRELMRIPLYGWYARKMEMIPVNRDGGAKALRALHKAATRAMRKNRQIVIFPEGTRRRPGDSPAYKPGIAGLYTQLGVPCVPVTHNSGLYWPRGGILKRPGTIVVAFLPPIPPGLPRAEFAAILEERIESATAKLLVAGNQP